MLLVSYERGSTLGGEQTHFLMALSGVLLLKCQTIRGSTFHGEMHLLTALGGVLLVISYFDRVFLVRGLKKSFLDCPLRSVAIDY